MLPLLLGLAAAAEPLTRAELHVLDNGLTVLIEPDTRTDEVVIGVRYNVGSRDERDGERGCAHLFEHLMFEATANVPNNAFDEWLTAAGGWNNAWTSEDDTFYYMSIPSGALELGLFLESDRMAFLEAGIDPANVANQRDVVLQERSEGYAEPRGRDWDALSRLLYPPGHPYHVPVIGTVADVKGFEPEAVASFWRRHYRPRNAVLFVVGNVDPAAALARVQHWFSDVPDPGPSEPRATAAPIEPSRRDGLLHDEVEERTVYLAWPTVPAAHPDAAALELASWILNGGRGTRLDDRLYYRSGLADDLGAYSATTDLLSQFVVYLTSSSTPLPRLQRLALAEIDRLARTGPTDDELVRAKRTVRSSTLDTLEDNVDRADLLVRCLEQRGDPNCVEAELAAYDAVTAADVQRVLTAWLKPEHRVTLSIVPPDDHGALPGATPVELP